jgi:hypothetical protein
MKKNITSQHLDNPSCAVTNFGNTKSCRFSISQLQNWMRFKIEFQTNLQFIKLSLFSFMVFLFTDTISAQVSIATIDGNPADWGLLFNNGDNTQVKAKIYEAPSSNDDIFTLGSKHGQTIPQWTYKNTGSNVTDKNNMQNAGYFLNGKVLFFFADTEAANGNAAIGFWLFQGRVGLGPNGKFTGTHTDGDLLVTCDFTGGGDTTAFQIYRWTINATYPDGALILFATGADGVQGVRCRTNADDIWDIPSGFTYTPKITGNTQPNKYNKNTFFEGYIDLEAFGLSNCFGTFLMTTRASQEITSDLEDLVIGRFNSNPEIYILSGSTTCIEPGAVKLSGSDLNISYQLKTSGGSNVGMPKAGTGSPVIWTGLSIGSYKVEATNNSTLCTSTSEPASVILNDITAGSIEKSQTICSGNTPASLTGTVATGTGTISYQWQRGTGSCQTAQFQDIQDAVLKDYSPGALSATTSYRRIDKLTYTNPLDQSIQECTKMTNCITVTVNLITAGSIQKNQTICSGDTPAPLTGTVANGTGIISYQWQSRLGTCGVDNPNTFVDIQGATAKDYSPGALTATTSYRRMDKSTLLDAPSQSDVACTKMTNCITVTINNITSGTISGAQTICSGAAPTTLTGTVATGSASPAYQWQSRLGTCGVDNPNAFVDIQGATSKDYSPGILTATTSFRRVDTSTLNNVVCSKMTNCIMVTVEVCGGPLCTYTQGYYGNSGGMSCTPNEGQFFTIDLIKKSIDNMPGDILYLGIPGRSFTTTLVNAADIITLLPGGGASSALPSGDHVSTGMPASLLKNGKINNNLLSQTITLALNIYMTSGQSMSVGNFSLAGSGGKYIVTNAKASGSSCTVPSPADCLLQPNAIKSYYMPANVISALGGDKKVSDLLQLASNALGGNLPLGLSYSNIQSAVDAINNAFDGCRYFVEFSDTPQLCPVPVVAGKGVTGIDTVKDSTNGINVEVYPVPFKNNLMINYHFDSKAPVKIEVFDIRGVMIYSESDTEVYEGKTKQIDFYSGVLPNQVYLLKVTTDKGSFVKKIISKQ